tara:strand:+ start:770 stop:1192 length:423 start_codon:yes stop_codon:yes gene_type:complete
VIHFHPLSITASPNTDALFFVGASGAPAPQCQWYRNGVAIEGANAGLVEVRDSEGSSTSEIYVEVSNPLGSVRSATAILTIGRRLIFDFTTPNENGANAILSVDGTPVGSDYVGQVFAGATAHHLDAVGKPVRVRTILHR